MRKIITTTFVTLDGVMQAPGGPEEDSAGGFAHGGWSFNYWDELMSTTMEGIMQLPFELLLGKCTYEIFAAFWPHTENDPVVADKFNSTRKYVVSHTPMDLTWKNSFLITNDAVVEIKKLKEKTDLTCGCTAAET
jgi:dihydrofolate reductase